MIIKMKHCKQNNDNGITVIMLQAEPAGITACNAKSTPPDKLVLTGPELMQAVCHQTCVMSIVWASSARCCALEHAESKQQHAAALQLPDTQACSSPKIAALPQRNPNASSIVRRLLRNLNDVVRGSYLSSPSPSVVQNRACGCWCVLAKHASRTLSESDRGMTCSIVTLHYVTIGIAQTKHAIVPLEYAPFYLFLASTCLQQFVHSIKSKNAGTHLCWARPLCVD